MRREEGVEVGAQPRHHRLVADHAAPVARRRVDHAVQPDDDPRRRGAVDAREVGLGKRALRRAGVRRRLRVEHQKVHRADVGRIKVLQALRRGGGRLARAKQRGARRRRDEAQRVRHAALAARVARQPLKRVAGAGPVALVVADAHQDRPARERRGLKHLAEDVPVGGEALRVREVAEQQRGVGGLAGQQAQQLGAVGAVADVKGEAARAVGRADVVKEHGADGADCGSGCF